VVSINSKDNQGEILENVVFVIYLTIYFVTKRNPRNDAPINIVCQFHYLYNDHVQVISDTPTTLWNNEQNV
jgi:hypothetical protein